MAIHCEPVSEPHSRKAFFETRWIAASLPLVAPRNDSVCCHPFTFSLTLVIARAQPVAIHCEPVSEPHLLYAFFETRWIAASD